MTPRQLLLAVFACALLYGVKFSVQHMSPAFANLGASIEGEFKRNGHFPGEPFANATGVRVWGSWAGSDENTGALALGPFPAPAKLRFAVGGYPTRVGNQIYAERTDTKAIVPLKLAFDVGERWRVMDLKLPDEWIGKSITLVARDDAKLGGGWLAVSEPIHGGRGGGSAELFDTLAAWAVNGVLLCLPWFAALRWLASRGWIAPHWIPLAAAGFVGACGYLAFWTYFANAVAGKIFSVGVLLLGIVGSLRSHRSHNAGAPTSETELFAAPKLLIAIGAFYIALLHLFPSSIEFHALAADRFLALPGDNTLPYNAVHSLFRGAALKSSNADWLSSDRPPLQSGWLLLTRPVTSLLHFDDFSADGTSAVWFQLLWVFAAFGLLRSLGLTRWRAVAWTALLAMTGFFLLNSLFTWPKLAAAAFACGAFALWILPVPVPPSRGHIMIGAAFAALAWLSHGGVAFSFIVLVPVLAWRVLRGEWRTWTLAAGVFALFAVPWFAFQKFYDPPGNRLLKWHLGGQIDKDARDTWSTIREGYHARSWPEIVASKRSNLHFQIEGDWRWWWDLSVDRAGHRREDEFFHTARALTWWLIGLLALPVAFVRGWRYVPWRAHAALATWTIAAILLWCILMFIDRSATIHQGSYASMLGLFVLLSAWCELASAWTLLVIAALQMVAFATTWAVATPILRGPVNIVAVAIAVGAAVAMATLIACEHRNRAR